MPIFQFIRPPKRAMQEPRSPTSNDDINTGIDAGDIWINTISGRVWINAFNTAGASSWKDVTDADAALFDTGGKLVYITRPPNRSETLTI